MERNLHLKDLKTTTKMKCSGRQQRFLNFPIGTYSPVDEEKSMNFKASLHNDELVLTSSSSFHPFLTP